MMKPIFHKYWLTGAMTGGLLLFTTTVSAAPNRGLEAGAGVQKAGEHQEIKQAVAVIAPTKGNKVHGTVRFDQTENGIHISAELEGLSPGKHAIHIHEFGDLSTPDGSSAGGHYSPEGNPHSGPDSKKRHAGDMGNLTADEQGEAKWEFTAKNISLAGKHSVLGRAVVIHAGADDYESQPSGAAGSRVAVGVIGIAKH